MRLSLAVAVFVVAVASYFLFYGGPDSHATRSSKELWNLGHIGYFALLVWLFTRIRWIRQMALPIQWLLLLLLTLALGTLIEVLQYGTERSPDLADILRDLTGALVFLVFYPGMLKLRIRGWRYLLRGLAGAILFCQMLPFLIAVIDEAIARHQFPLLSDFSTPFERDRWKGGAGLEVVKMDAVASRPLLKVSLGTTRYSGVGIKYFPADWSRYHSLNLKLYVPDEEALMITLRVHDRAHESGVAAYRHNDRFNRRYRLHQGWNEISVDLTELESGLKARRMDLRQVSDVSFFASSLSQPRVIYLQQIILAN